MSKILYTDLMEFSTDELAQTAWVSDADSGLPSAEYSVGDGIDEYTKLLLHANGGDATTRFIDNANDDQDGNNCVLMLHFDGADTATSTIDASLSNHTVTFVNDAQIDTAQSKFGGSSLLLDGTGDYLTIPASADWDFGAGDFTIDCWVRFNSHLIFTSIASHWYTANLSWNLVWNTDNKLYFYYSTDGSGFTNKNFAWTPSDDTWYHIAIIRNGNDHKAFIDGTQIGSTESLSGVTIHNATGLLNIGANNGGSSLFDGWIDEFRISKGIARWTSNFNALNLQCYSEDTIKEQGSYSLKIESNTDSLNDTLTKTLTDYLDYSVMDVIKFSVRASRTGSNIKLKIHDTGGTTSEHTINIASADTWQTEIFDISAIATADRDTIDKIIIEIINADVANTIYVDNLFSKAVVESSHTWVG